VSLGCFFALKTIPCNHQICEVLGYARSVNPAFEVVERAINASPIPGASVALGVGSNLEFASFGRLSSDLESGQVTPETIYDLASLTKVLVTVPLLLKLVEQGRLDPAAPLFEILPEVKGFPLQKSTILELVSHTSGLQALSRLRFWNLERKAALEKALTEPLRGSVEILYSDQGFIVLTHILEKLYGARLDSVARDELFAPLDLDLTYHPEIARCAPTEFVPERGGLIFGRVHDENTAALEGVSGHAGLFGTARDVALFLAYLLEGRVVGTKMLELMASKIAQTENDARAFGWVMRHNNWSGGDAAPSTALGHTGFTGTGAWFDPKTHEIHVLLTNRVNPSREVKSGILELRREFNDIAWKHFDLG
jgi:CubicO group peptidase (beta-lactamase class C family)